jgi:CheY-like chemotaxis protein
MTAEGDVLIVDDDDDMLEALEFVLEDAGYATRTAQNGRQALETIATRMPRLILLDMLMPVMNGWQFTDEFRSRYGRDVPIVVVTAAEHARSRCSTIDVQEVLTKPFDVNDLLKIVEHHVAPARPASP